MTMIDHAVPAVTPEADGAALHAALLAEANAALDAVLTSSATAPEELAALLDGVTGGGLDEMTLSVLADVLAG
jgi:hypothetical protein